MISCTSFLFPVLYLSLFDLGFLYFSYDSGDIHCVSLLLGSSVEYNLHNHM